MRNTTCLTILGVALASLSASSRADTVYAVSNSDGRIVRYDSADPAGTVVTLSGTGLLVSAAGLALGPDGNLYVGEAGNGGAVPPSVRRLNLSTNTLSTVYTFSAYDVFPGALVFQGNNLLVGRNPFFVNTGQIMKLANATGGVVTSSTYTTGGSLQSSPGLALGADGSLYVSSQTYNFGTGTASGPVVKFDAAGVYVGEIIPDGGSGLAGPTGLGISGTTLYTASIMNGAVLRTNLTGTTTSAFGTTGVPFGASPLALLSDGGVIVGSAGGTGAVYRLDAAGSLVGTFNSGLGTIGGLVVTTVPEPAAIAIVATGAIVAAALCMRRRRP